jgi:hypothetical protein
MLIDGAVHQDSSAQTDMSLTFALLIGLLTGLRCLTPAAAIAWAAYLGWLHLPRSLAWMVYPPIAKRLPGCDSPELPERVSLPGQRLLL